MTTIALSVQLLQTVYAVTQGQSLDQALLQIDKLLRLGVQALSFHTLRHLGQAQALAHMLLKKPPPSAVQAAKSQAKWRAFAPLINAVLRRFLREQKVLQQQIKDEAAAQACWNFQPWWVQQMQADWPQAWETILRVAQVPAPMTLRVNQQQISLEQAGSLLKQHGIENCVVGIDAIELHVPVAVENIPAFAQGAFSVQAAAAQLAAPLLLQKSWLAVYANNGKPLRILDACAAPGGRLLYCTCSIFKAEGHDNAQNFILRHNDVQRLEAPRHLLPLNVNDRQISRSTQKEAADAEVQASTDGFYHALFEKCS